MRLHIFSNTGQWCDENQGVQRNPITPPPWWSLNGLIRDVWWTEVHPCNAHENHLPAPFRWDFQPQIHRFFEGSARDQEEKAYRLTGWTSQNCWKTLIGSSLHLSRTSPQKGDGFLLQRGPARAKNQHSGRWIHGLPSVYSWVPLSIWITKLPTGNRDLGYGNHGFCVS